MLLTVQSLASNLQPVVDGGFLACFVWAAMIWIIAGFSIAAYREDERKTGLVLAIMAGVAFGQFSLMLLLTLFMEGWLWWLF